MFCVGSTGKIGFEDQIYAYQKGNAPLFMKGDIVCVEVDWKNSVTQWKTKKET